MSLSTNSFSTKSFRSVLLGSTAIAVGMVFVFGAGLVTPAVAEPLTWDNDAATDNWDQDDGPVDGSFNWIDDDSNAEDFNPGDDAIFGGTAETVTVVEDVDPASITFNTSGYVIQSDPSVTDPDDRSNLNIVFRDLDPGGSPPDAATIDVATAGTAEISAVVRFLNDVTVNGAGASSVGTLILSGENQDLVGGARVDATITLEGGGLTIAGTGQIGFEDSLVATGGLLTVQGGVNVGGPFGTFDRGSVTIGGTGAGAADLSLEGGTIFGQTLIEADGDAFGRGGDFAGGALLTGGSLTIEQSTGATGGIVNGNVDVGTGGTVTINQFEPASTTSVTLTGDVTNNLGATVNNGIIDGNVIQNGGTVANNGDVDPANPDAQITGTVMVNGGVFTNSGDVDGAVTVQGTGAQFNNTGDLDSTLVVTDGNFDNQAGGTIMETATVSGDADAGQAGVLTASGGVFTGGIDVQTDGRLNVTGDTGTGADPVGITNNGGTIDIVSGTLTTNLFDQQSGITTNAGNIVGAVNIADGTFDNDTGGDIDGIVTVGGPDAILNADGGTFQDNINIDGGTLNINSTFDQSDPAGRQVILNSGQINIGVGTAAPVTFTTDFTTAGGTTNIGSMGILDNVDAVDDTILLNAGALINSGIVRDQVVVGDGGTLGIAGGTFDEGVDAQGGIINITESSDLSATGLENNGSTITINAEGTLTPGPLTLTGDVTNNSGTIASSGNIDGELTVTAAADGGGATSQFTQNADTAAGVGVTGQVTVSGANAANQGVLLAQGGTFGTGIEAQAFGVVTIGDDTIDDLDVTGDVVNNGGTVDITATGQLTGSLTNNSGTSNIATGGTLTGPLTITGTEETSTVNVGGVIAQNNAGDQVTVTDGTLNLNDGAIVQIAIVQDGADVDGVAVPGANGGVINANDGAIITSGLVGRSGEINIDGAVSGLVRIEGSDFTINNDAVLTGGVIMDENDADPDAVIIGQNNGTLIGLLRSQAGVFDNNGIIQGPGNAEGDSIVVSGGQVNNNEGGDVTTTARVESGTLIASGGDFTGGVIVEETTVDTSTFTVTADMEGNITNNSMMPSATGAGAVTINAGTTVTGNLTNNSGQATVNGRIGGTVAVGGTEAGSLVVTNADTVIDAGTTVTGGTLTANGGTFTGGINATDGLTSILGTVVIGPDQALISDDGMVNITGTVNGDVQANNTGGTADGVVTSTGLITRSVTVGEADETGAGAVFNNSGNIMMGVTVNNGTFNMDAGAITTASTVNEGGSFIVTDDAAAGVATFNDGVDNNGGDIQINGNAQGDIRNTAGTASIADTFALTGNVTNGDEGTLTLNGDIMGTLGNNGGIVNAAGAVSGASTNQNTADDATSRIFVDTGDIAEFSNGLANSDNGLVRVQGTLNGAVTNAATGEVRVVGGTLGGPLTNSANAAANFNGTSAAAIINNSGVMNVGDAVEGAGTLTTSGLLTNLNNGVVNVNAGSELDIDGGFTNALGGVVNLNGFLDGEVTNNGQIFVTNGGGNDGLFGGDVTNNSSNSIYLNGSDDSSDTLRFGAGLANTGSVDAATNSAFAGDIIDIAGPLTEGGLFRLNIDLADDETGTPGSDVVRVSGPITGNPAIVLEFVLENTNGRQEDDILVFDVNGAVPNTFTYSVRGLPDASEAIVYAPTQNAEGDILIQDALNPGIGGLAGSIVLTQSLIGSVVNRPSSPFVSGLAYDDPNPCGVGAWGRGIGGQADSSGEVTELIEDGLTLNGEISANYYGLQFGGDVACFNGYFDGWDISVGGIGGLNSGTTEQPVFGLVSDGDGGLVLGGELSSITTVDFDQAYGGIYVTGARDRFSVDLQYRVEQTDFVADNEGTRGASGLGLEDAGFSSDATTFSGSVSYAIPFGESDIAFVPTAGFAYSNVSTGEILFNDTSSVQVNDFTSETVFAGGTLSRTSFGEDGTTATNQFATVTFYNDFAEAPTSLYTPRGDTPVGEDPLEPRSVVGENLGAYAELSAGLNYIRILPVGAPGGAKQLSASVRGDLRTSDRLSSWGITSQFRIQF